MKLSPDPIVERHVLQHQGVTTVYSTSYGRILTVGGRSDGVGLWLIGDRAASRTIVRRFLVVRDYDSIKDFVEIPDLNKLWETLHFVGGYSADKLGVHVFEVVDARAADKARPHLQSVPK